MALNHEPKTAKLVSARSSTCTGVVNIAVPGGNVLTAVHATGPLTLTNNQPSALQVVMVLDNPALSYNSTGAGTYRFVYEYYVGGVLQGVISQDIRNGNVPIFVEAKTVFNRPESTLAIGGSRVVEIRLKAQADTAGLVITGACLDLSLYGHPI